VVVVVVVVVVALEVVGAWRTAGARLNLTDHTC